MTNLISPRIVVRCKLLNGNYLCKLAHFTKSYEPDHYVTLTLSQIERLTNKGFYNWTWNLTQTA